MSKSVTIGNTVTMSSREIAELTGKEHRNVMRDIRAMLVELHGAGGVLSFEHTYLSEQNGQTYPEYRLPRREVEILLTGYSIPLRAKVIDRLHELEQGVTCHVPQIPQTFSEALRLAADLADQNIGLRQVVAEQAPKVAALDRLTDAGGAMCMTDAAKHLNVPRKDLLAWLQANRWIYRRAGAAHWVAYQPRMAAGYLLHRVTVIGEDEQGERRLASQVRVTPKGMAVLARQLCEVAL